MVGAVSFFPSGVLNVYCPAGAADICLSACSERCSCAGAKVCARALAHMENAAKPTRPNAPILDTGGMLAVKLQPRQAFFEYKSRNIFRCWAVLPHNGMMRPSQ